MKNQRFCLFLILVFQACTPESREARLTPASSFVQPVSASENVSDKMDANPHLTVFKKNKNKKKHHIGTIRENGLQSAQAFADSGGINERINKITYLRRQGIIPDLNEPGTERWLETGKPDQPYESMIEVSRESGLMINFDNDILDYTDRFYTNGIRLELILPVFRNNPASRLLVPSLLPGKNYYGIALVQNMYTPSTTKIGGILYGDRPYSAYLLIGFFKISNSLRHTFRQTSELNFGIIGPGSYGEWVQRSFHNAVPTNNEPLGWEYQIQNDLVLNYSIGVEKGLIQSDNIELIAQGKLNVGTLYNNIGAGIHLRAGWAEPWFTSPLPANQKTTLSSGKKFRFFFFLKSSVQAIGYDATLQGGMFNKSSVYVIPGSSLNKLVSKSSAGIGIVFGKAGLDIEQFLLSPEYQPGYWHKWVHIGLKFAF